MKLLLKRGKKWLSYSGCRYSVLAALKPELNLNVTLDPCGHRAQFSSFLWEGDAAIICVISKERRKTYHLQQRFSQRFKGFLYHLQPVSFMCVTFQASFSPLVLQFLYFISRLLGKGGLGFPVDEYFHPKQPFISF